MLIPLAVFPQNTKHKQLVDIQKEIAEILQDYQSLLKKDQWITDIKNNSISAFRYKNEYNKLLILINIDDNELIYQIKLNIKKNNQDTYKEFLFRKDEKFNLSRIKNTILAYLTEQIISTKNSDQYISNFNSEVSVGYNRTHDNHEFYPEYGQGSFYMSGMLKYDPAKNITTKELTLKTGDYLAADLYFAYDSHMRENYFNIDLLISGKNRYFTENGSENRELYGFFNGFEYFRPGFYDPTLEWSRKIYKKQPHIQYNIWRVLQWGIIKTEKDDNIYDYSVMAGFGPSINSSLTINNVTPEEEKELSHIFKSIKYRKQNYYYGIVFPFSAGFSVDRIYRLRFGFGYNFYFFYPVENEDAYDMLNIVKLNAGFYITEDSLFNALYEYWHIKSKLRSDREYHFWNRLVLEIKYLF